MKNNKAFSLVELLVVMAIICVLSGIVFRLFSSTMRDAAEAETIAILERISNACAEYRAEYGEYPPVTSIKYEYESPTNQSPWLRYDYIPNNPEGSPKLFEYGLIAYLWTRERSCIEHRNNIQWVPDTPRDIRAKNRWFHFIDGLKSNDGGPSYDFSSEVGMYTPYTNKIETINDAWGREIFYKCYSPHQTYMLWSAGEDGVNGTPDDVHKDKWDN